MVGESGPEDLGSLRVRRFGFVLSHPSQNARRMGTQRCQLGRKPKEGWATRRLRRIKNVQNKSGMLLKAILVGAALKAVSIAAGARALVPYL
jgi:hypothetical protein